MKRAAACTPCKLSEICKGLCCDYDHYVLELLKRVQDLELEVIRLKGYHK